MTWKTGKSFAKYLTLLITIILIALITGACSFKNSPETINVTPSIGPSQIPQTQSPIPKEPDFVQFDILMHYLNGIQIAPLIYNTTPITLKASDGFTIKIPIVKLENGIFPISESRQNETVNTSLLVIPKTDNKEYILWNQHKLYHIDFSIPSMDILLVEQDEDTSYTKSLAENQASGLYWGTKPVLSENGKYLLYLTNRRNNGKTNDIRLYDFETKKDILLSKDAYYNDAYISDTTVFYTCNDNLVRIDIDTLIEAPVSYSVSSNGSFSYPYYIYTTKYYQHYEILNMLTLDLRIGTLGAENSALKIMAMSNDDVNIAAVTLLNKGKVTLSFLDLQTNAVFKTFVVSESFRVVYTQWKDDDTFLIGGYEGGDNEKTFLFSY